MNPFNIPGGSEKQRNHVREMEEHFSKSMRRLRTRNSVDEDFFHWMDKIPWISFPASWEIKAVPPMGGVVIRYWVRCKEHAGRISVYLDCHDTLAVVGHPYWEIFPTPDDDIERYDLNDVVGLLDGISKSLKALPKA